jgi:hypothetical protein
MISLLRQTRGPNRKCSGGNLLSQRVQFVRSSFDWVVCSEPQARLRRTRDYGYSIVSRRFMVGEKAELESECSVEAVTTRIVFGRMRVSKVE